MVPTYTWYPRFFTAEERSLLFRELRRYIRENRRVAIEITSGNYNPVTLCTCCYLYLVSSMENILFLYGNNVFSVKVEVTPSPPEGF